MDARHKFALIETSINAGDDDPRARRLDSKVYLSRDGHDFGFLEMHGSEIFLSFYGSPNDPMPVAGLNVSEIVGTIASYGQPTDASKR